MPLRLVLLLAVWAVCTSALQLTARPALMRHTALRAVTTMQAADEPAAASDAVAETAEVETDKNGNYYEDDGHPTHYEDDAYWGEWPVA